MLSESRSARANLQQETSKHCSDLSLQIMTGLQAVLATSIETVGQIDNVRLVLAECLRASVHALARTGETSFSPRASLPDFVVPSIEQQASHPLGSQSLPKEVTFFRSPLAETSFRLTFPQRSSEAEWQGS